MAQGRPSRRLNAEQIERLEKYRRAERKSFAELNSTMANPFTWEVLKRAMAGRPVWELNHAHIVAWIERFLPVLPVAFDPKMAAAGKDQ